MNGDAFRLSRLNEQLEEMERNPKNATVADYMRLASERSAILLRMETDENLNNQTPCMKERRAAVTRLTEENY